VVDRLVPHRLVADRLTDLLVDRLVVDRLVPHRLLQ